MLNADTVIVKGDCFFHYCHGMPKSWMALRSYRKECPFCKCQNPRFIKGTKECFLVSDFQDRPIMAFDNYYDAIDYMQEYHLDNLAMRDVGLKQHGK